MPQQSRFDSSHVVPVLHPNGEVHSVAIPPDLDLGDFHRALLDSEYGHQIFAQPQPRREDALEFSPQFRDAAAKAIRASGRFKGQEAGFAVHASGMPASNPRGEVGIQGDNDAHHLAVVRQAEDMAIFHTHHAGYDPKPSPGDIEDAKKNHMTIYAASPDGLWAVDPGGKVTQVFNSRTWYDDKNPK